MAVLNSDGFHDRNMMINRNIFADLFGSPRSACLQ